MHVLIVGGTRFVGYLLAWRLLAGGHRLTLLNRGTRPDPFGDRVERLRCDRTQPDFGRVLAERTFDAVVDFAAYRGSEVRAAVGALAGKTGHYVFVSTGQVYLVLANRPRPAKEEDFDGPIMPVPLDEADRAQWDYGIGKRECEEALVRATAFPSTRIRIPMVNGELDHMRRIESYLWRLLDGGPVLLPDGGTHAVRHVYGNAVARAIAGLLGDPRTFGKAYNLAQEEAPTLAGLLVLLAHELGASPRFVPIASALLLEAGLSPSSISPFSGSWMSFLDPARARDELGFEHEPLSVYLGRIVASFLAHPPQDRPEGYASRAKEIELAARLG